MTPSRTVPSASALPGRSPSDVFKQGLEEALVALDPVSVLDVGCGDGGLLGRLAARGRQGLVGLEPDPRARAVARSAGLEVVDGLAERLPFDDGAFDVVVFDYVTHHLGHLPRALREAARVSKRAVLVLEAWYDDRLASQRVARRWDEWLKRLDRRAGDIHFPSTEPQVLIDLLGAVGEFEFDYSCRLIPSPVAPDRLEAAGRARLASPGVDAGEERELMEIVDEARLVGVSEGGGLLFEALRIGKR